jgi:hypothetical protein
MLTPRARYRAADTRKSDARAAANRDAESGGIDGSRNVLEPSAPRSRAAPPGRSPARTVLFIAPIGLKGGTVSGHRRRTPEHRRRPEPTDTDRGDSHSPRARHDSGDAHDIQIHDTHRHSHTRTQAYAAQLYTRARSPEAGTRRLDCDAWCLRRHRATPQLPATTALCCLARSHLSPRETRNRRRPLYRATCRRTCAPCCAHATPSD